MNESGCGMGVDDLRQKRFQGKGKFGTDKRHQRGGMRQKSVKMYVFGTEYNQRCTIPVASAFHTSGVLG